MNRIDDATGSTDWDDTDDILKAPPPLGTFEITRRMAKVPWLEDLLDERWPLDSDTPYLNAYATTARLIWKVALLETTNPDDITYALNTQKHFVLMILGMFKSTDWEDELLPIVRRGLALGDPIRAIDDDVSEGLSQVLINVRINAIDLLKVCGEGLYTSRRNESFVDVDWESDEYRDDQ